MYPNRGEFKANSDGCLSPRVSSPDSHCNLTVSSPLSVSSDPGMSSQPYIPNYYVKQEESWTRQHQYYGENNNLYNKYDYRYKSQRVDSPCSSNGYGQDAYYRLVMVFFLLRMMPFLL